MTRGGEEVRESLYSWAPPMRNVRDGEDDDEEEADMAAERDE